MKVKVIKVEKYPVEEPSGYEIGFNIEAENGKSFNCFSYVDFINGSTPEQAIKYCYNDMKPYIDTEYQKISNVNYNNIEISESGDLILTNPWHETELGIQIIFSYDNLIKMLNDYPEIGEYKKVNEIKTYIENGLCYSYINFIYEEHRLIFQNYGAKINEV